MSVADIARALATEAHQDQRRRHGAPYLSHPIAVATIAEDLAAGLEIPFGDDERAIALMHDVIEDSPAHPVARIEEACGIEIAREVAFLTKTGKGDDATAAYYDALRRYGRLTTRLIKLADRLHNLSELHKTHGDSDESLAKALQKTESYLVETQQFVRGLIDGEPSQRGNAPLPRRLHRVLDHALENARRNAEVGRRRRHGMGRQDLPVRVDDGGLYAILQPGGDLIGRLDAVLAGGAVVVQLRVKSADGLTDRQWLQLARSCLARCADHGVPLVVNDRCDLARALQLQGADDGRAGAIPRVGVHVGDTDLPPLLARAILGPLAHVGTSTHDGAQLAAMDAEGGASHLALGPIWASSTKVGHADVVGEEVLKEACAASRRPVVAIGGITTPARVRSAAAAGAALVATVSAVAGDDLDAVHLMARRLSLAYTLGTPT